MILDNELYFSNGQLPGNVGTNLSTNVLDTSPLGGIPTVNGGRDLGQGERLWLDILVKTTLVGSTATLNIQFITDSNPNLVTSPVVLYQTGVLAIGTWVAGTRFLIPLPSTTYKRYIGMYFIVATANITAGAVDCRIEKDEQQNTKYASSFSLDV